VCAVGVVLACFLPERALRETVAATAREGGSEAGGAFAQPVDDGAAEAQLVSAFTALADRDVQRAHIARIVARAGETLSPLAAWLLVRIDRSPGLAPHEVGRARGIGRDRIQTAVRELESRGLITVPASGADGTSERSLSPAGCAVMDRLVAARREHLADLLAEWDPGTEPAANYLRSSVLELVADTRRSG
jgi:DNA-binding MarR family transcriptional regulator